MFDLNDLINIDSNDPLFNNFHLRYANAISDNGKYIVGYSILGGKEHAFLLTRLDETPTANAGPDQTVNEGDFVTLDGSGSLGDGDPLTIYD